MILRSNRDSYSKTSLPFSAGINSQTNCFSCEGSTRRISAATSSQSATGSDVFEAAGTRLCSWLFMRRMDEALRNERREIIGQIGQDRDSEVSTTSRAGGYASSFTTKNAYP